MRKKGRMVTVLTKYIFCMVFWMIASQSLLYADGAPYIWTANGKVIQKVAWDGTVLRKSISLEPFSMAVNANEDSLWIVKRANSFRGEIGEVMKYSLDGRLSWNISSIRNPKGLAIDTKEDSCWISKKDAVVKLSSQGEILLEVKGFTNISDLAVNTMDGSCWLIDKEGSQTSPHIDVLVKLSSTGEVLIKDKSLKVIRNIAVDSETSNVWVGTYNVDKAKWPGEIIKLSADCRILKKIEGFHRTPYIAFNPANGSLWVADWTRLLKISQNGRVLFKKAGFKDLKRVVVQPFDSSIWVREFDFEKKYSMKISDTGNMLIKQKKLFTVTPNPIDGSIWGFFNGKIWKYASSGKPVRSIERGSFNCNSISVNPLDGGLWALGKNGPAIHFSPEGKELSRSWPILTKGDMRGTNSAINPFDGTLWVSTAFGGNVIKLAPSGKKLLEVGGLSFPTRVSVSPKDGSCWIGDDGSNEVIKVNSKGEELFRIKDHIWPEVFVNPYTDNCWVASDYKISKYSADGTLLFQKKGYEGAVDISINPVKDTCWVYYHAFPGENSELAHFASNGDILFHKIDYKYFVTPVIDPVSGNYWWKEWPSWDLLQFAPDGTELLRLPSYSKQKVMDIAMKSPTTGPWLPRIFQKWAKKALTIKCTDCRVEGRIHSRGEIVMEGDRNEVTGAVSAVRAITIGGTGNTVNDIKTYTIPHSLPTYDLKTYEAKSQFFHDTNWEIKTGDTIESGIHFVEGNVIIRGYAIKAKATIIATGKITISGKGHQLTSADTHNRMLFFSGKGRINVKGSGHLFNGIIYAPNGGISLKGPNQTYIGSVIGRHVWIIGKNKVFKDLESYFPQSSSN